MDEKQTAALHEVFEAWAWGNGYALKLDVAETAEGLRHTQAAWAGFLACYQHLAPQLKDAERYRWLRNPNHNIEPVIDQKHEDATIDGMPAVIYEYRSGEELDKAIDAAREQEKKSCD